MNKGMGGQQGSPMPAHPRPVGVSGKETESTAWWLLSRLTPVLRLAADTLTQWKAGARASGPWVLMNSISSTAAATETTLVALYQVIALCSIQCSILVHDTNSGFGIRGHSCNKLFYSAHPSSI